MVVRTPRAIEIFRELKEIQEYGITSSSSISEVRENDEDEDKRKIGTGWNPKIVWEPLDVQVRVQNFHCDHQKCLEKGPKKRKKKRLD